MTSPQPARLRVVLCWHMHQPEYRDLICGEYQLPWVYLHAIKDYVDMAAHLESVPAARAVVNFAPILLEQIADYAAQLDGFLREGSALRDPMLAALAQPALPLDIETRLPLIKACLRANERLLTRFSAYKRLTEIAHWLLAHPASAGYVNAAFLADLLVWHHLAWLGETVRRTDTRVQRLLDKAAGFSVHDRRELLSIIHELVAGVVARYARLATRGQVELSVTPYAHPILPLLIDLKCAREAMPDALLPLLERYPNGIERARWHLRAGIECFQRHFGFAPRGCWPSEGALSTPTLDMLAQFGFAWTAGGQSVLGNTLKRAGETLDKKEDRLYTPYKAENGLKCFFRDDELSDFIGFTYASWHGDDAVSNLIHRLEQIADRPDGSGERVVAIIMDGENAWEHYPDNAYHFLSGLYRRLSEHPRLTLTTFAECLNLPAVTLPPLVAGSWVYGTLSTWIGDRDKNRGWDMLGDAARIYYERVGALAPDLRLKAELQLAICEGSDWFWWFGDYNPASTVSDFERLYRLHLTNLYQLLGAEPPEYLASAFTRGTGAPVHGGTMRPGQEMD